MRRMFRLSDASHKDIDLGEYEDEILEIADSKLIINDEWYCMITMIYFHNITRKIFLVTKVTG